MSHVVQNVTLVLVSKKKCIFFQKHGIIFKAGVSYIDVAANH